MKWIFVLGILTVMAIEDVRERQVRMLWILLLAFIGLGNILLMGSLQTMFGMLPGAILLGVSKITGNGIGTGDGLALMSLGLVVGFWAAFEVFTYSSLFAGIVAVLLLISGKGGRKTSLPNLLFLLLGYVVFLVGRWLLG